MVYPFLLLLIDDDVSSGLRNVYALGDGVMNLFNSLRGNKIFGVGACIKFG